MIILGSDHAGLELKEKLKKCLQDKGHDLVDVGAFKEDSNDSFADYVKLMAKAFKECKDAKIIAVCGSGVGMSIGLNRNNGIYCVLGYSVEEVKTARLHNNVNALALGGRVLSLNKAKKMIEIFLNTEHLGGKYLERMKNLDI